MKKLSTKRNAQMRLYKKKKAEFLASNTTCFSCGGFVHLEDRELHHFYGRVGRLLDWLPGFTMVCRVCHDTIHNFPGLAHDMKLIADGHAWNNFSEAERIELEEWHKV